MFGIIPLLLSDPKALAIAACTSLSAAFLVGGYEFMRVSASSLFVHRLGSEKLPYAMAAVPVCLFGAVYVYGLLLSWLGSLRTLMITAAVSVALFILVYLHIAHNWVVALFYILSQGYIVILFEQYWSFINSTLKKEQAKILNGPILFGANLGPLYFAWLIRNYSKVWGTEILILLGALCIVPAMLLMLNAYKLAGEPHPGNDEDHGKQGTLHLSLLRDNKTLFYLALVVMLSQSLSTIYEFAFSRSLEKAFLSQDAMTAYLGEFWIWTTTISMLMQLFGTPLFLSGLPLRWALLAVPCLHMLTGGLLFSQPFLPIAALGYGAYKCLDYSLFRAGKETLYIPLSFDARFRAKQMIDTLLYRISKGATAGLMSVWAMAVGSIPLGILGACASTGGLIWAAITLPLTSDRDKIETPE